MTDAELNKAMAMMMGWLVGHDHVGEPTWDTEQGWMRQEDWTPATNIAQAMEVAQWWHEKGAKVFMYLEPKIRTRCWIQLPTSWAELADVYDDKLSRAICLAALAAHNAREGITREVTT